jgi:RimJ/RimL family protein N-acetyltransferase
MQKNIQTERLLLRQFELSDSQKYFEINQDADVIEFLPGKLTLNESEGFIRKDNLHKYGYCLYAAELKQTSELIGFIGLNYTGFLKQTEVGWRLGREYWGNGYATEGATACLDFACNTLNLNQIISFTVLKNTRSIKVMEKIGL